MDPESGLVSYRDKSYDGELFVRQRDIQEAALKIGNLLGRERPLPGLPDRAARNIHFGMVDHEGESHPLMLGGVAFGPDLSMTFWSSPHTTHSQLVASGKRASVLVSHTHEANTSLRMKKMLVTEVAPDDQEVYLQELNHSRKRHNLGVRELEEFTGPTDEGPRSLYVATPSSDRMMNTIPLGAYSRSGRGLIWQRDIAYPITAAQVFPAPV